MGDGGVYWHYKRRAQRGELVSGSNGNNTPAEQCLVRLYSLPTARSRWPSAHFQAPSPANLPSQLSD
jgi:hypothetical protein